MRNENGRIQRHNNTTYCDAGLIETDAIWPWTVEENANLHWHKSQLYSRPVNKKNKIDLVLLLRLTN